MLTIPIWTLRPSHKQKSLNRHTHTHTHTYRCVCVCVCVFLERETHIQVYGCILLLVSEKACGMGWQIYRFYSHSKRMHTSIYIYIYIYTYIYMYIYIYANAHVHTRARTHTHTNTHIHPPTHTIRNDAPNACMYNRLFLNYSFNYNKSENLFVPSPPVYLPAHTGW